MDFFIGVVNSIFMPFYGNEKRNDYSKKPQHDFTLWLNYNIQILIVKELLWQKISVLIIKPCRCRGFIIIIKPAFFIPFPDNDGG